MTASDRWFSWATTAMLAVVVAVLAGLLTFQQSLGHQIRQTRQGAPLLVSRVITFNPGTDQALTQPLAWSGTERQKLLQGLEHLGTTSGYSGGSVVIRRASGQYVQATILHVGADLLGYLGLPPICRSDTLYLLDRHGRQVPTDGAMGRLHKQPVRLRPLPDSTLLKIMATTTSHAVAVSCAPTASTDFLKLLFMPRHGKAAQALAALKQRTRGPAWSSSQNGVARHAEVVSLADAVADRIARDYRWLPPFIGAFAILLVIILTGFALFDAARTRPAFKTRRALGASMGYLLATSALRVGRLTGSSVFAAILILAVTLPFIHIGTTVWPWLGLAWTLLTLVLASLIATAAHAGHVLWRIDAQLTGTTHVAGHRWKSLLVGICMAVMTLALAQFMLFAAGLDNYFRQLQNTPLGYMPTGLQAYTALPTSTSARDAAQGVARRLADSIASTFPDGTVSITCNPPWDQDDFLADGNLAHAAIAIGAGTHFFAVMGIHHSGRDVTTPDLVTGTARWLQSDDPAFIRRWQMLFPIQGHAEGVRVGALTPQSRDLVFRPISHCQVPVIVTRRTSLQTRLQALTDDYRIQLPVAVDTLIAQARSQLAGLRRTANLGFAAAFICMLLVASLTAAAWVQSRRRVIAIRAALGESSGLAALGAIGRSSLQAAPALLLAALATHWTEVAIRSHFASFTGLDVWHTVLLCVLLGVVIQGTLFLWLWRALSRTNFSTVLRED